LADEMAFDSWYILPATEEIVFAEDTGDTWRKLLSSRQYRAAVVGAAPGRDRRLANYAWNRDAR
jgi:putative AlgH/UPF0301 family transcriptional regulator